VSVPLRFVVACTVYIILYYIILVAQTGIEEKSDNNHCASTSPCFNHTYAVGKLQTAGDINEIPTDIRSCFRVPVFLRDLLHILCDGRRSGKDGGRKSEVDMEKLVDRIATQFTNIFGIRQSPVQTLWMPCTTTTSLIFYFWLRDKVLAVMQSSQKIFRMMFQPMNHDRWEVWRVTGQTQLTSNVLYRQTSQNNYWPSTGRSTHRSPLQYKVISLT